LTSSKPAPSDSRAPNRASSFISAISLDCDAADRFGARGLRQGLIGRDPVLHRRGDGPPPGQRADAVHYWKSGDKLCMEVIAGTDKTAEGP
jgi:hypothetical protein